MKEKGRGCGWSVDDVRERMMEKNKGRRCGWSVDDVRQRMEKGREEDVVGVLMT